MELIINELSFRPPADSSEMVALRFQNLLKSFNRTKETYGFSHMCFPQNYRDIQVTNDETLIQWINNLHKPTIKNLVLGLCKKPYADDLKDEELTQFYQSDYTIIDTGVPANEIPYGLPIAHIKSVPSISINSHVFWTKRKIKLRKSNSEANEDAEFFVFNICKENDVNEIELEEWANKSFSKFIKDEESLTLYLNYTKYTVSYSGDFMGQLLQWKETNITQYQYTLLLMKDVELHPFTGGMGQTENLKKRGKEASKRVSHEHRLSYTLDSNNITFIACIGHYKFH